MLVGLKILTMRRFALQYAVFKVSRAPKSYQGDPSMSFLSLSAGDPAARNLLQKAIKARYGLRPLPVDSVRLTMTTRAKGPLGLPATAAVTVSFIAPTHWRW